MPHLPLQCQGPQPWPTLLGNHSLSLQDSAQSHAPRERYLYLSTGSQDPSLAVTEELSWEMLICVLMKFTITRLPDEGLSWAAPSAGALWFACRAQGNSVHRGPALTVQQMMSE